MQLFSTNNKFATKSEARFPRIAVVDDDEMVRDMVGDALEAAGYIISLYPRASRALEVLPHTPFDAVLCDMKMPEMDGAEFYHRLCKEAPYYASRFLFLTGDTQSEEARAFLEETQCRNLEKPFSMVALPHIVAEICKRESAVRKVA